MTYELAKGLKDAGFPQDTHFFFDEDGRVGCEGDRRGGVEFVRTNLCVAAPSMAELIEACPPILNADTFDEARFSLSWLEGKWVAMYDECDYSPLLKLSAEAPTPEEAVVRLWLALNKS
jgi:hypothetical protein